MGSCAEHVCTVASLSQFQNKPCDLEPSQCLVVKGNSLQGKLIQLCCCLLQTKLAVTEGGELNKRVGYELGKAESFQRGDG